MLLMIAPDRGAQSATGGPYRCRHARQCRVQVSVTLGLCAVPCNKSYHHTLKNYKRSPRHLIGQIADQKTGTCILLWHSKIVVIYYFILFYCYFLFLIICNEDKKTKKTSK